MALVDRFVLITVCYHVRLRGRKQVERNEIVVILSNMIDNNYTLFSLLDKQERFQILTEEFCIYSNQFI